MQSGKFKSTACFAKGKKGMSEPRRTYLLRLPQLVTPFPDGSSSCIIVSRYVSYRLEGENARNMADATGLVQDVDRLYLVSDGES